MLNALQTQLLNFSTQPEYFKPGGRIVFKQILSTDPIENHLALIGWRNDPEIMKHFYSSEIITIGNHLKWVEKVEEDDTQVYFGVYAVKTPDGKDIEPTFIGVSAISHIDIFNSRTEYGRLLIGHSDFRKGGYGHETELMMLEYVFENLSLRRFYLEAFTDNIAVINLHHKTGFTDEGIWKQHISKDGVYKDVLLMAMMSEDYFGRLNVNKT